MLNIIDCECPDCGRPVRPAAGSAWVHRETQTVVEIAIAPISMRGDANYLYVRAVGIRMHLLSVALDEFRRDYLPNELVSLELLERCGWKRTVYENERMFSLSGDCLLIHSEFRDHSALKLFCGTHTKALHPLKDTADVLRLMRVFGLEVKL
jgi:hypothetical protein